MNQILIKRKNIYFFKGLNSFPLICAFSDRTLNLGFDNIDTNQLKSNRKKFLESLGINYRDLVCMKQVHGANVICVTKKDKGKGAESFKNALSNCDGMITKEKELPLAALTADCLPIFLYEPKNSIVGVLHAGWRSTHKNIVSKALDLMKKNFNTKTKDLIVAFGPAIRSCCYEVGSKFRRYFSKGLLKRKGRFYLDLIQINKKLLINLGVKRKNILDSKICTSCCNEDFFSHRKEGVSAGRMMSVIMLNETTSYGKK